MQVGLFLGWAPQHSAIDMTVQFRFVQILVQVFASRSDSVEPAVFCSTRNASQPITPLSTSSYTTLACHLKRQPRRNHAEKGKDTIVSASRVTCIVSRLGKKKIGNRNRFCVKLGMMGRERGNSPSALETVLPFDHFPHGCPCGT